MPAPHHSIFYFFTGWMLFLTPNEQCPVSKHSRQWRDPLNFIITVKLHYNRLLGDQSKGSVIFEVRYIQTSVKRAVKRLWYIQTRLQNGSPDLQYLQSIFTGHQIVYTTAYPHSSSDHLFAKGRRLLVTQMTQPYNKNSSGDEIANVNFYAMRPEAIRIRWNNAK